MLSATVEDIKQIGQIKKMLVDCSTEADVDSVFSRFSITDFPRKTTLLRQSMQVQEVFGTSGGKPLSDEDIYKEELKFFLDGQWRDLV